MKLTHRYFETVVFLLVLVAATGNAVPSQIRFQGRLTDKGGNPIVGTPRVIFDLFATATGGDSLWHSGIVSVTSNGSGLFSTDLGPMAVPFFSQNEALYLQVTVVGAGGQQVLTPRQSLASVPFALQAHHALSADSALSIADGSVTAAKLAEGAVTGAKINSAEIDSLHIKDGGVSSIDIAPACISSSHIKDGTITSADLSTGAVTGDNVASRSLAGTHLAVDSISAEHLQDWTISDSKVVDGYALLPRGAIVLWSGNSCPTGFSRFAALDGLFPMGAPSYSGVSKGNSAISGLTMRSSGTHSHTVQPHAHDLANHTHTIHHRHTSPVAGTPSNFGSPAIFGIPNTIDDNWAGEGYENINTTIRQNLATQFADTQTFRFLKTKDSDTTDSGRPSDNSSGLASPETDGQGAHAHSIEPLEHRPPYLEVLFCQRS